MLPGARCGWCTQVSADKREGRCKSSCTSTRDCSVTCPVPYTMSRAARVIPYTPVLGPYYGNRSAIQWVNETTDCGYAGYTYSTSVTPQGQSNPKVRNEGSGGPKRALGRWWG